MTEAFSGRHRGSDAFNLLCLWEKCTFLFISANPQDKPLFFSTQQSQVAPTTKPLTQPFVAVSPLRMHAASREEEAPSAGQNAIQPVTLQVTLIPYPTRQTASALRVIESFNLSRIHRQVLLLIDGQRSIAELIRLTSRNQNEMYRILQELEQAAVIRIPD